MYSSSVDRAVEVPFEFTDRAGPAASTSGALSDLLPLNASYEADGGIEYLHTVLRKNEARSLCTSNEI
jgi:hypothetical protein